MRSGIFICSWTYGDGSRPVYYKATADGHWTTTFDITEATQFKTKKAAIDAWLEKHAFPDEYWRFVEDGSVRAQEVNQQELLIQSKGV